MPDMRWVYSAMAKISWPHFGKMRPPPAEKRRTLFFSTSSCQALAVSGRSRRYGRSISRKARRSLFSAIKARILILNGQSSSLPTGTSSKRRPSRLKYSPRPCARSKRADLRWRSRTSVMAADKRLGELLDFVVAQGGSDLHLFAGGPPMLRVSGALIPMSKHSAFTAAETAEMLKSIVPPERFESFEKMQTVDLSYAHKENVRFRVNGYQVQGAAALAFRLIPRAISTFTELNLPPILEVFTQREQGFFLVVGPVGQGKSTTLATMIDRINDSRAEHVLTIEDPVEYLFTPKRSLIHQREVHIDPPDFHTAIQSAFREDVDVIMVGEMRDYETISSAVTAAETGHLVFSTLHTNNAAQT